MLKKNIELLRSQITEDMANHRFYGICGSAYLIMLLTFFIGFFSGLNTTFLVIGAGLICVIPFIFFCPMLEEKKRKVGFAFLFSFPVFSLIIIFSHIFHQIPMANLGKTLSLLTAFITVACFVAFYFSETGSKTIEGIKENLTTGFNSAEDKMEKAGDVQLCIEKETQKPEIWHYKDRFLHMLILGPTGSGKTSQTILPLVNQDMQNPEAGVTVLEPKGDFAQKAAMMAEHYGRPYVYFDPSFKNCPHFNPLFGKEADVVENMATTFRMLNPDSPQFFLDLNEQLMRNAVKVLKRLDKNEGVDGRYATMINLSRLLQNSGGIGRKMVVQFSQITSRTQEEAKENADISSWFMNDYFAEKSKVYENTSGVRSQVSKLVSNEYLRAVLNPDFDAGERNEIDFDKHLAEGGVICICTAQGVLRDLGRFLGYFIILQFQSAVFRRPGNEDTRRAHFLYIDEFQTYSNPGFSDMLTQGRSYRVACHLATQARAQMAMGGGRDGKNFVELVSTNARNIVLYPGCSKDDAEYYSKQFGEYEKTEVQVGKSYKTFNLITGGLDRLGHPTETIREAKKMTAVFSASDLIYRPFGEIVYCIIKKNSIQVPKVGEISYIPKDLNDKLDGMINDYIEANRRDSDEVIVNPPPQPAMSAVQNTPAAKKEPVKAPPVPEKKAPPSFIPDPAADELAPENAIVKKDPVIHDPSQLSAQEEAAMMADPSMDNSDMFDSPGMDPAEEDSENLFSDTYTDDCMDDAENDFLL